MKPVKYRLDYYPRARILFRVVMLFVFILAIGFFILFFPSQNDPLQAQTALELLQELKGRHGTIADAERVLGPAQNKAFNPDSGVGFYGWEYSEEFAFSRKVENLWVVAQPAGTIEHAELRSKTIAGKELWDFRWKRFKQRLGL
jgi:hypothetical protein